MNEHRHEDFDRRMRTLHARAVSEVSSRTAYQLKLRREAAMRGPSRPAPRASGWWLAAAATAVFALAIGLRQPEQAPTLPAEGPPTLASVVEGADTAAFDDSVAALDEDPDLYLWLASQDGLILAME